MQSAIELQKHYMRSYFILTPFILALLATPVQSTQIQSPMITREGEIQGPGATALQDALLRFYQGGDEGKQWLIFVGFCRDYTGTESETLCSLSHTQGEGARRHAFYGSARSKVRRPHSTSRHAGGNGTTIQQRSILRDFCRIDGG
jgi:hypothetical protein